MKDVRIMFLLLVGPENIKLFIVDVKFCEIHSTTEQRGYTFAIFRLYFYSLPPSIVTISTYATEARGNDASRRENVKSARA